MPIYEQPDTGGGDSPVIFDNGGGGGVGDSGTPYGGGTVYSDGSGYFAGSGGYVGGLSPSGANYSSLTGAGSAFNSFTPSSNPFGNVASFGFAQPSKPYKGMDTAGNAGKKLITLLQGLFTSATSDNNVTADELTQATGLAGLLNNPNYFYQARSGRDNRLMNDLRAQASGIVSAIAGFIPATGSTVCNCVTAPCNCDGNAQTVDPVPDDSTGAQEEAKSIISRLSNLLNPPKGTNFEAPPNLFQMTPTGESNSSGGSMQKILIIGAVIFAAYWMYKKYA